ncbi:transposase [Candidatus Tisiphia endosymbiont of Hybos culiciformis]|uniref:transposase n=1 Tax=Candidatus Tisiphia endosymbiont of Hybos culiciformis TaxID=3139331 RepID=UPI003CCAB428
MNKKTNESIKQAVDLLIDNDTDVSTILKEGGLLKELTKRLIEKALQSELNNHLGYDKYSRVDNDNTRNGITSKKLISEHGTVEIEVPRDRRSTFEPAILPKRQKRFDGFDVYLQQNCITLLNFFGSMNLFYKFGFLLCKYHRLVKKLVEKLSVIL